MRYVQNSDKQVEKYVSEGLGKDPNESLEHLEHSEEDLAAFYKKYVGFQTKMLEAEEEWATSFTLKDHAVIPTFLRLQERIIQIKPILSTIIEFNRFDKTEVGGAHGHILSPKFVALLDQFHEVETKISNYETDFLKCPDPEFQSIIEELGGDFLTLDTSAVAIAIAAIEDVPSIVSLGQILSGFNALLYRPYFIEAFKAQYLQIISLYNKDLEEINATYREEKNDPPELHDLPPTTSKFFWSNGLGQRVKSFLNTVSKFDWLGLDSENVITISKISDLFDLNNITNPTLMPFNDTLSDAQSISSKT
jgi:hypothetical protein